MSNWIQKIDQLLKQKEMGIISEEEFLQARKRIMSEELETEHPEDYHTTLRIGSYIRDYRIISLIGQGGMGEVYEIEHKNPQIAKAQGRRALKLMLSELVQNKIYKARFIAEAAKDPKAKLA